MFVIEKFRDGFNKKQEAWERACQKWIDAGADEHGYNYRSERDYRNRHGRSPKEKSKFISQQVFTALAVCVMTFLLFGFIREVANQPDKPVKASSEYKNGDECGKFHIGDIASIDYGDYDGAEVEIIGGCENHADYETRVTKDQVLNAEGSENEEYNDKPISKGLIIKVNDSDNLTKTGHVEEK